MKRKWMVLTLSLTMAFLLLTNGCIAEESNEMPAWLMPPPVTAATAAPTAPPARSNADITLAQPDMLLLSGATASTTLRNDAGETKFGADHLIDGEEETSWQCRTKDISKLSDASFTIYLYRASQVTELWIKNGFWKITDGYDQYVRNSRPKKIAISFLYDGETEFFDEMTYVLRDDKKREDWQKIELSQHDHVTAVRVTVLSIYTGTKFKGDIAVSEVALIGVNE